MFASFSGNSPFEFLFVKVFAMLIGKPTKISPSRRHFVGGFCAAYCAVTALMFTADSLCSSAEKALEFTDVKKLVDQQFSQKANYKPGDLITRGDVATLLSQLEKLGLKIEGGERDFDVFIPDNHVLPQLLRTPQGRKLMRKIKHLPQIYDRLEKLTGFSDGQQMLVKLSTDVFTALQYAADSEEKAAFSIKPFEELCTAETAQQLEWSHPSEPACQNFAVPTGHVYTEQNLLEYIKTLHKLHTLNLNRPAD